MKKSAREEDSADGRDRWTVAELDVCLMDDKLVVETGERFGTFQRVAEGSTTTYYNWRSPLAVWTGLFSLISNEMRFHLR
jgi:hypothetical protein